MTIQGTANDLTIENYKWLYKNSGVGIGFFSPEGIVLSFNLAAAKDMNGKPEDFIGQSIFSLFSKEEADLYLERIKLAANSDQPMLYEDFARLPTEDRWFLSTYTRIDNDKHHLLGIQIIAQDITKLKLSGAELLAAKEAAEKNQRLLNITGEIALVGGWEINLRLNTLVWTKQVYAIHELDETFMPTVEAAIGFYQANSIPIIQKAVSDAVELGTPFDVALKIVTAKGTIKDVRAIGYVQRDQNNMPEYVYGTFQDISKQNKIMEELISSKAKTEENERKFRNSIENSPIPMALAENNGDLILFNRAFVKTYGYTLEDIPTISKWFELAYPDPYYRELVISEWDTAVNHAIEEKAPIEQREYSVTCKNGDVKIVSISAYFEKSTVYSLFMDITERKQAEQALLIAKLEAEQANRAKSEFLSNMSHEIRTPLNGVFGFTQLLSEMEVDAEKKEYLDIIKNSSSQLLSLINDILSLSKIEAGKFEIKESPTNLFSKIHIMANGFIKQAQLKGLTFNVQIDNYFDRHILIDHQAVFQIVNNLLSNAVKFSKVGFIQLTVKAYGDKSVEIVVKDTGIGINEEKQKHLFEAFEQGEYYLTKQYGGTGLGLAIVKKTVDLLNGQILVSTQQNIGTEIRVVIPFNEIEEPLSLRDETNSDSALKQMLKIISAEDVEVNQLLLEKMLQSNHTLFKKVYNGEELLAQLSEEDYHIVLMDIQMPGLNGIEATKKIRSLQRYKNIPIIAVSAYAFEENIDEMIKSGIDDYISKPINKEELISKVNKWAKGKSV